MNEAPGYTVIIGERPAIGFAAPAAGNGFMVGVAAKPPTDGYALCYSISDFVDQMEGRVSGYPTLYDAVDGYFREGGGSLYVAGLQGGAAVKASKTLVDAASKNAIKAIAAQPGEWGNKLKLVVTFATEKATIAVYYNGTLIATSPALGTNALIQEWAEQNVSDYVVLEDLKTAEAKPPKAATSELTGGDDKRSEIDAEDVTTALDFFNKDLGPGQVAAPGFTTEAIHEALMAHAAATNRRAMLDLVDTADDDALAEAVINLRDAADEAARFSAAWAPAYKIPGLSAGTERVCPASAIQMGKIARAEGRGDNPNKPAAGKKRGESEYAIGLTQTFTETQHADLNAAGVNVAILVRGVPRTMGNVTVVDQSADTNWRSFSASRTMMALAAAVGDVLEDFEFEQIDGHGYVFKELEGAVSGRACTPLYLDNALYGQTPGDAFQVATGPDVNTLKTIEAEEIHVQVAARVSPTGEHLVAEVVKVRTGETI